MAAEAARDRWVEQVRIARVVAARDGIEHRLAGFHLIRPDDDPYWDDAYGDLGCSGNIYCWDLPQIKYPNLVYNEPTVPEGIPAPAPGVVPSSCEISLDRVFSNAFMTLTVEDEGASQKRVVGLVDPRARIALSSMLQPRNDEPTFGLIDWFGTPRGPGVPHTLMKVVLVSDNFAYVPFAVQDILAQPPGAVSVTLATGLSESEAVELVDSYERR